MDVIEIPPFFTCPISLDIMKDPVIVSPGITYDRRSIEKWLSRNTTCPVTKLPISAADITPNHALRRLTQAWCTLNASHGVERFPTPKPPITEPHIRKLLLSSTCPLKQIHTLKTLRALASESDANRRCIESAGALLFLASIVNNNNRDTASFQDSTTTPNPADEALITLYSLQISDSSLKTLLGNNGEFVDSLTRVMKGESRAYAVLLLNSILQVADPTQLVSLKPELFAEIVKSVDEQISEQATKAALQVLVHVCPLGRNRVKAVEGGAVPALIKLLLEHSSERRINEMVLVVLDLVCGSAEGRAELLGHGAGLAVVSKKIMRVSRVGSDRAVRIILAVSKLSATASVVQEMLELGVAAKMCLLLQVGCSDKTKERAKEILKLHARAWTNSSCIPTHLQTSYRECWA